MPKLSTTPRPKGLHVLIYGPAKIGKSALAGEMAEHGYTLIWFDLENGSSVLHSRLSDAAKENVDLYRIPDSPDWPIAVETMMKVSKQLYNPKAIIRLCELHGKIECPLCGKAGGLNTLDISKLDPKKTIFVMDSLTQYAVSSMNQISKGIDINEFKPGWDEFGKQGQHLNYTLGNIQNSPWHWIVITHEQELEQGDGNTSQGKIVKIGPVGGTKNYSKIVPRFFDEVVYMRIHNREHKAVSETTVINDVLAGSRNAIELSKVPSKELTLLEIFEGKRATSNDAAVALLKGVK